MADHSSTRGVVGLEFDDFANIASDAAVSQQLAAADDLHVHSKVDHDEPAVRSPSKYIKEV